jgi:uncharacterized protein
MELTLQDKPCLIEGQYTDTIEDYILYYNPLGFGGITIIDFESLVLIGLCDGKHTIKQIIAELSENAPEEIITAIRTLAEREVLWISDYFTQGLHDPLIFKESISCWMHLSNSCNLACSYCYIHKSPGDMSLETGKLIIDKIIKSCQANNISKINLKFAGGEPLLRFDLLIKLAGYSQKMSAGIDFTYTILTNGALITQQIADYIKNHKISLGISLDGIGVVNDSCRFDRFGKGSFNKVIKGLNILRSSGIEPFVSTTISNSNYLGLFDLTRFFIDNDYYFRYSLERNFETGAPTMLEHSRELIESLHKCYDYIEGNLPERDITNIHSFCDVNFKVPSDRSCGAGYNFFAVGHDRKLGFCGQGLSKPFSTLNEDDDILSLVRSADSELVATRASDYPSCNKCIWNKSCAGGCPQQTKAIYGKYNHPSPYCEVYKQVLPRIIRIKGLQMIRDNM